MNPKKILTHLSGLFSMLLILGGQPAASHAQGPDEVPPRNAPTSVDKGELFRQGGSSYPRLVRLSHSGEANGRIMASMTTYVDNSGRAVIYESDDHGESFHQVGEIRDPAGANAKGMCCSTLYELPTAVGDMPAGTLLWAGTAGIGVRPEHQRRSSIRLWRSSDHGRTWEFLSNVATPPPGPGVWEPEFTVSEQGHLVAFYSDDMGPQHDQKIVRVRSKNGRDWTDYRDTVIHDEFAVRPGMPGVRELPDGTYVMVYEVCNNNPARLCGVYMRTSKDGWNFGEPRDLGIEISSDKGNFPMHTPTIAWAPGPGRNGRLILAYQFLVDGQSKLAPGNGKSFMVNDNPSNLASGWREIPSPVRMTYSRGSSCRNFSPTVVATRNGTSLVHLTTDYVKYPGPCEAFYAKGPINSGTQQKPASRTKLETPDK